MIELPTLYCKSVDGGIDQWTVSTEGHFVCTAHGKMGGKLVRRKTPAEATNVGRANMRMPEAQAEFEAMSAWKKKLDQGYFDSISAAQTSEVLLPMLAQKFKAKNLRYPISAQRKLNGLRCMAEVKANGSVRLMSRGGKDWDVPHIAETVKFLGQPGDIFDGEMYIHGVPLQTLNSLVKNSAKEARLSLQYHIYDMPKVLGDGGRPWEVRWANFCNRYEDYYQATRNVLLGEPLELEKLDVQKVETRVCLDDAMIKAFERESVLGGFEGLILRLHGDGYAFGLARPKSLMKWKTFQDEEFLVTDMRSLDYDVNGTKATICDVCYCRNNLSDATFKAKPRGSVAQMTEYWKNKDQYIGKRAVVRFLERSNDGIPQGNPVLVAFRLDEDLPAVDDQNPWE